MSSVELLSVSCTEESECTINVDISTFEVTGDTDCGVCDPDGNVVEVQPASSDETDDTSDAEEEDDDVDR